LSFNAQWYEAFGVLLCNQCKSTEQLISKVPLAPGAAALVLALYEARPLLGTPDALPGQERPRVIKIPPSHTIIKQSPTKKKKKPATPPPPTGAGIRQGAIAATAPPSRPHLWAQAAAKEQLAVTDADLRKLGSLRRPNPRHKDWQHMHLYMQSQVRAGHACS
jgi:hypothetical protein